MIRKVYQLRTIKFRVVLLRKKILYQLIFTKLKGAKTFDSFFFKFETFVVHI